MNPSFEILRLLIVMVQSQDIDLAIQSLTGAGLFVIQISSSGAFLGRRNATLLIGLNEGQETVAFEILKKSCRRRVEYLSTHLEGSPFYIPLSTPVSVGGGTIFGMKVEKWEVIP